MALPGLGLPIVIRSAVVEGVATATEVATIGVVYTVIVGVFFYRCFDWRRVYPILVDTASLSGAILLVVGAATAMAWALTQSGFSQQLVDLMVGVPGGRLGFLAISALAFVVLGSVLEGVPAIVLFGPLLFPVARVMGVNEVHYAIVAVFSMGLGLFTPPFGVGFYLACAIGRVSPDDAIKLLSGRISPRSSSRLLLIVLLSLDFDRFPVRCRPTFQPRPIATSPMREAHRLRRLAVRVPNIPPCDRSMRCSGATSSRFG